MMTLVALLDLLLIVAVVAAAFVWMRPVVEVRARRQRAWGLVGRYALAAFVLWWVGLLQAGYPLAAALLVGGGVALLHVAFVALVVWIAAQRAPVKDA